MTENYAMEYRSGGIVQRIDKGQVTYLLVTSNSNWERWIIPAGHIETGETAEEAALREVREEAGVEAKIITHLGDFEYTWYRNKQRIIINTSIYLMDYLSTSVLNPEGRDVRFFRYEEIDSLNIWEESRQFLYKVHKIGSQ